MKVALLTFGCRVNQAESQAFERELCAAGAEVVGTADADLVLVNSCSVTATADQGTRQSIRRVARENPTAKIVVTGCYATRAPDEVAALPGVVHVVPNVSKDATLTGSGAGFLVPGAGLGSGDQGSCSGFPESVWNGKPHAEPGTEPGTRDRTRHPAPNLAPGTRHPAPLPLFLSDRTTFTLRVQTGCEESCSYCVIPSTRGAERSTPVVALVEEVRRIEAAGYREITLTGVHLGSYGRDLAPPSRLVTLVRALIDATDLVRFRLGSLEPMDCTPALVEQAASGDRLAPAFHLPLQHASDRILLAMGRPYTCREYDDVVRLVRARVPHASITADVIVGFPGETCADFEVLTTYLEGSPLTQLHVFPYSDRPGTEASAMTGKVHGAIVRERARLVRELGVRLAGKFRASQAGSTRLALTIGDGTTAVTDNGLRVRIWPGHGRNVPVRVLVAEPDVDCAVEPGRNEDLRSLVLGTPEGVRPA